MKKNLVIVESPAKAKTINKFLGNDFQVEASMGHVRDLPKSKMGVAIENNFKPEYVIMAKSRKIVSKLKKTAEDKGKIYLAPDPDREGEAISWHLAWILRNSPGIIKRVTFNEITKDAIQKALEHPRDIDLNLVNAQQARRILDRIVGYSLSPLLWRKVSSGLSAGRVQSVALRLIVEREQEINRFQSVEFWTIEAEFSSQRLEEKEKHFIAKLDKIDNEKPEIKNEQEANSLKEILLQQTYQVVALSEKHKKRKAPPPFITSKLQQEAFNQFSFPAAKTMRIAQKLYEGIDLGEEGSTGLITYMRTDSFRVASSAQAEALQFIKERFGKDYVPKKPNVFRPKKGAQEAHEAIRPTFVHKEPEKIKNYLSKEEFKLYELIWKRFLASQMSEALDLAMVIEILGDKKYLFKATGSKNLFPGFLVVYQEEKGNREEKPKTWPQLIEGEKLNLHEMICQQHFTKPPPRYNDASLVKTLEEKGIGRPSTYAPTIFTLFGRNYIHRREGALVPTELGEMVEGLLTEHFPSILDYKFTAYLEEELDKIEEGKLNWLKVLTEFYTPFKERLEDAKNKMRVVKREVIETDFLCDICGKKMVIRWGKFGKFLACSGFPQCKYTKSIPTGYRCSQEGCNGELVRRMSKKKRFFYGCSNYPKCKFITNKLPKKKEEEEMDVEEKPPEGEVMEI